MADSINVIGAYYRTIKRDLESGYTVFLVRTPDYPEKQSQKGFLVICGTMPEFSIGTPIQINGYWEANKYGTRLKAKTVAETALDRHLLLQYLTSDKFPGVSIATAVHIIEEYGAALYDSMVKKNAVQELISRTGITLELAEQVVRTIQENKAFQSLFDYIVSYGGNYSIALELYKQYGSKAKEHLQKHPYRFGMSNKLSFFSCDKIAAENHFSASGMERVSALMEYAVSLATQRKGHTYVEWPELIATAKSILTDASIGHKLPTSVLLYGAARSDSLVIENRTGECVASIDLEKSLENCEGNVFPIKYRNAEISIAKNIKRLLDTAVKLPFKREYVDAAEKAIGKKLALEQQMAFQLLKKTGIAVLTGDPGTGKTTVLNGLLYAYQRMVPTASIFLAAPAGRAAQNMAEKTQMKAVTIHKLLEYMPVSETAKRNASNPIPGDLIIIDETSMADIELISRLLEAVKNGAFVIFLGDPNQLASVEPGDFLRDLISSRCVPVIELKAIFRQAQNSTIIKNAKRIIAGDCRLSKSSDFVLTRTTDIPDTIKRIACKEWDKSRPYDFQVLCPVHKGADGEEDINFQLQELLNPYSSEKPEIQFGAHTFRVGDKILMTRNNYDVISWYFNGDIGILVGVNPITIAFENREIKLSNELLSDCSLAYAMTVCKAQGSEFNTIVVVLSNDWGDSIPRRNLLYTAVTRAKRKVYIVFDGDNSSNALNTAIKSNKIPRRKTKLKERLRSTILPQ